MTSDVVRVDASGVTSILPTTNASALVWDASMHTLWFGTPSGDVGHMNADGTTTLSPLTDTGEIKMGWKQRTDIHLAQITAAGDAHRAQITEELRA